MLALIAKMLFCLLLAAAIGFVMAWLIRGLRSNPSQQAEAEVDALRTDLAAQTERVAALEAERDASRAASDSERSAALAAAAAAATALAAAHSSLADKEQELASLQATVKASQPADVAALRKRTVELEGELAAALAASSAAAAMQAELVESRQALAELRTRCDAVEGSAAEDRQSAHAQLATLTAERDAMAVRLAAFEKAERRRLSKPPRQFYSPPSQVDDLEWIYGIGPKLAEVLNQHGVYQFRQVAMWNDEDIEFFDRQLDQFHGRIRRENWVQSAQEEHHKKYGEWLGEGDPTASMPETGNRS